MKKLLLAAAIFLTPLTAYAQQCLKEDVAFASLGSVNAELAVSGLDSSGNKLEIWASDDNQYFLLIRPKEDPSIYCLIDVGTDLNVFELKPGL